MTEHQIGLEILQEVSQIANSTLDLNRTLESIIEIIQKKMHVDACAIYLEEEDQVHLRLKASSGLPKEESSKIRLKKGKGITGWVAEKRITLALSEAMQDPRFEYFPEIEEEKFQSMLSVPILLNEQFIGVINVHTLEQRWFQGEESILIEAIASQVAGCIRNAVYYSNSQMLLKELTILYDISLAVQSTLKLKHGLWIILNGITIGQAGGFNRVMLFIYDENTRRLQGMMGLGPDSPQDAVRLWTELDKKGPDLLQWIVTEANKEEYNRSAFNRVVRSLKFPVNERGGVLSETILRKKGFHIHSVQKEPLVNREFIEALGTEEFATAPLIAHESVLGLILADNRYNRKPITEEQIRLLTRFSSHASWVMENSRLFSKLLDTNRELLSTKEQLTQFEKLAALGEMAAEVAHEIKNPLVSIGGFARRLRDTVGGLSGEFGEHASFKSAAKYSQLIVKETERLEALVKDILLYSKAGIMELETCDINKILHDVAYMFKSGFYEKNIDLKLKLAGDLPPLQLDLQRIKQVLINLFYNAMESMANGGEFTVSTSQELYAGGQKMITLRLQDTGKGIPQEIFENIFNPFFTTKDSGTGMGLPICRKIIEAHNGTIRFENVIGKGVTVILHLPLQIKSDYYKN